MKFELIHSPLRWVFIFHIACGATALLIFSIPLLTKKGGKTHVKTGWIYVAAMSLVAVTAYIITPWRALYDSNRNSQSIAFAIFLFLIATFASSSLWYGLLALKNRARTTASHSPLHLVPPILLLILSVCVQIIGFYLGNVLLIVFPIVTLFSAKSQLDYWRKAPTLKRHWWYAHMEGMFVACISTVTAFLVTAVPRIWPGPIAESPVLWMAPGAIMGFFLNRWTTKYKTKFGDLPQ